MKNNEDLSMCEKCGGQCCKRFPCEVFPKDLGVVNERTIRKRLKEGFIFDSWGGDFTDRKAKNSVTYFMRSRSVEDREGADYFESWGGRCIFLGKTGCKFSWARRPSGGKSLIPKKRINGKCIGIAGFSKEDCAKAWEKYYNIIEKVLYEE